MEKSKKKIIITLVVLLAVAVGAIAAALIIAGGGSDGESQSQSTQSSASSDFFGGTADKSSSGSEISFNSSYVVPDIDADSYYSSLGTVVSSLSASDPAAGIGENAAFDAFSERGFEPYGVTVHYDLAGAYIGETAISRYSVTPHPVYSCLYTSAKGELWQVSLINGVFSATKLSADGNCTLSESDTITAYDSATNRFFVISPNPSAVTLKTVARIDAETIEAFAG